MDAATVRDFLGAFGISLTDVTVNPLVIVAMLIGTYWVRRAAAAVLLPRRCHRLEAWADGFFCWFGNLAWAIVVIRAFEAPMPWRRLLIYALVLDTFAIWLYERFGKAVLERVWGPVPGPAEPPKEGA